MVGQICTYNAWNQAAQNHFLVHDMQKQCFEFG